MVISITPRDHSFARKLMDGILSLADLDQFTKIDVGVP
jgi:hypothetical protein